MTQKQKVVNALMSDGLVTQNKFKNIQLRTRICELRKEGLSIKSEEYGTPEGKMFICYELNYKKSSKRSLKKYGY